KGDGEPPPDDGHGDRGGGRHRPSQRRSADPDIVLRVVGAVGAPAWALSRAAVLAIVALAIEYGRVLAGRTPGLEVPALVIGARPWRWSGAPWPGPWPTSSPTRRSSCRRWPRQVCCSACGAGPAVISWDPSSPMCWRTSPCEGRPPDCPAGPGGRRLWARRLDG